MADLHRLLEHTSSLHKHLCPRQVLGVRMGMYAGELLDLRRSAQAERRRLDSALAAMNLDDAHRLGMALAEIAKRSTTLDTRLVRAGRDSNATLWVIEREPDAP